MKYLILIVLSLSLLSSCKEKAVLAWSSSNCANPNQIVSAFSKSLNSKGIEHRVENNLIQGSSDHVIYLEMICYRGGNTRIEITLRQGNNFSSKEVNWGPEYSFLEKHAHSILENIYSSLK